METINKLEVRNLVMQDYLELRTSMVEAYTGIEDAPWKQSEIKKLLSLFPEGQLVVLVDDKVVGCALSIVLHQSQINDNHTYEGITGNYTFSTHNPKGNVLYGIDVFIHPKYRGLRLGRRLYEKRKELTEQLNLKSIMFAGRIPNYSKYANECTSPSR